jgi:hypothetical protein
MHIRPRSTTANFLNPFARSSSALLIIEIHTHTNTRAVIIRCVYMCVPGELVLYRLFRRWIAQFDQRGHLPWHP